jgi:hypothetical protein
MVRKIPLRGRPTIKASAFRLILALVAVVALALLALGYTSTGESGREHAVGSWQLERALSGNRVVPNELTRRSLNASPGRGWTRLHEVAAARSMSDRVSLLAARSQAGDVCLGISASAFVGEFRCVSTNGAARDEALLHFTTGGGARFDTVDRISVVGIARSDVARVEVTTPSGRHNLQLNSARGFAYDSAANGLPSSISAYGADGTLIAEYPVGT